MPDIESAARAIVEQVLPKYDLAFDEQELTIKLCQFMRRQSYDWLQTFQNADHARIDHARILTAAAELLLRGCQTAAAQLAQEPMRTVSIDEYSQMDPYDGRE